MWENDMLAHFAILVFAGAVGANEITGPDLIAALRQGGCVIVMRHASSPRTPPDAAQADPQNTTHERQLDEEGRTSARAFGDALRRLQLPLGAVLSSPTYRALETARLAKLTATPTSELGDAGHSMQPDPQGGRGQWLRTRVGQASSPGKDDLLITHLPNIAEAFGQDAAGLEDGEALVFRPDGHGGARQIARVKISEWTRLAGGP